MILSRKQGSVSETRAQAPMGKFIQLSEGVFTRWKNCMAVLSLESDSDMAEFLLNRLVEDRLREMGQQNSREGTPSPIPSDSAVSGKGSSSSPSHLTQRVHSPSPVTVISHPTAATESKPGAGEKQELGAASFQSSTHSSDFAEYKHKLERRKRKPVVEHNDSSIKVAKTASESERKNDFEAAKPASSGTSSAHEPVMTGDIQEASVPLSSDPKDGQKQDPIVQRQDVIVTPRSQSQHSSEAFHGACGEEAMDLSVRPTKDSFMEGLGQEHVDQRNLANDRDPSHPNYQSTLRRGYVGVYDSSDLSDGSQQCVSPQSGLNKNKVSSNDSGSDFDSCSESPVNSSQQGVQGREELDSALNSPRPGTNIGGIESIVQRLHQVKSETPSRSDSEDESDYYAVTFKDLIARTISRCDRYGKTQQRGKRKRASRTSSELSAARKEEIMAAKKLLERVSKSKRDKFKLTINCSTDGSEHVRNAAASEAIATLVRNVWHKENPKPIGQVIKEMVAKRLAGQEGEENGPRSMGQSKRKGPMTIKDILNSRSENVVEEFDRSAKLDENDEELLIVDVEKEDIEDEADLALSAAETLRKMAKINEKRDENCEDPIIPVSGISHGQQKKCSTGPKNISDVKTKLVSERDGNDDDSDEEDLSNDHEQRKKAKRRSRKKKRRWAKMFAKSNEEETVINVHEQKEHLEKKSKINISDSGGNECLSVTKTDVVTVVHPCDEEGSQWPAEAVKVKGSVAQNVVQMSGDVGMGTMRSLVEKIQDEDEEVDIVMETKEIPRLKKESTATPEVNLTESIPAPKQEPPKPVIISHSISQILEQKGSTSSVDIGGRCSSGSSSLISAQHNQVHLDSNAVQETPSMDDHHVVQGPRGSAESSSSAGLERTDERVDKESSGEGEGGGGGGKSGGKGEIKSMSTATEFLIRIALMQNEGSRKGAVETQ